MYYVSATWVDRFSVDSEGRQDSCKYQLTPTQVNKFSHFFSCLLDHDQDDLIGEQDFETLIEVNTFNILLFLFHCSKIKGELN